MKAISIMSPFPQLILFGRKKLELRNKPTNYRGDIFICVSKKEFPWYEQGLFYFITDTKELPPIKDLYNWKSMAIAIATITDCRPTTINDAEDACVSYPTVYRYAYVLENVRCIIPFPVKGQQGIFNINI